MKLYILPYKAGSKSAKSLAQALNTKRIKLIGSRFRAGSTVTVVNWGNSSPPAGLGQNPLNMLNASNSVRVAANKRSFFEAVTEYNEAIPNMVARAVTIPVNIPEFTTDREVAKSWQREGKLVVERHKLTGNSAEGVVIADLNEELGNAKLYVKYIPKKAEFRVHATADGVIFVQKKVLSADYSREEANWHIRNHAGGFIFQQENITVPQCVIDQALTAVKAVDLDFGAVDVIYNERQDKAYVLEINTAPGLQGTSAQKYAVALQEYADRKFA